LNLPLLPLYPKRFRHVLRLVREKTGNDAKTGGENKNTNYENATKRSPNANGYLPSSGPAATGTPKNRTVGL